MLALLKRGFSPTAQSVNRLLSSLLRAGKYRLLLHVFSQVSSNSAWADSVDDDAVVRALLETKRFAEAEDRLLRGRKSRRRGLWDALIYGVSNAGKDPEKGFGSLLKCLKCENALRPSPHTLRSLVFAFASDGRMDRAIEVVEMMTSAEFGYPLDNYVCSSVISGFCKAGEPELGLDFYEKTLKDDEFSPNLMTYTAVLDALMRSKQIKEASDLVQRMEDGGIATDASLYACWASGCVKNGDLGEALLKHKLMTERRIDPDVVNYSILVDGFCKEGNVEKTIGLLSAMKACGIEPNLITYTSIIHGFCKRGKLKEATALLEKVQDLGIPLDEFAYSTLIDGWTREGDFEMVFKLLDEMGEKEIFLSRSIEDAEAYMDAVGCNVIERLCKGGMLEAATKAFQRLVSRGIVLDPRTRRMLIGMKYEEGQSGGVLELMGGLDAPLQQDFLSVVCNDGIIFLCRKKCCEAAKEVFLLARRRRWVISLKSYYFLSKSLLRNGHIVFVSLMLSTCVKEYGHSESRVMSMLALFLCKNNAEKALRLLGQMERRDVSCCVLTAIVESLRRVGRADDAYKLVMEARENGMAVDVVTYSVIIDGLCKEGRLEKALMLCKRMRDVGLRPNIFTYNSILKGLCGQGCLVEAMRLFDALGSIDAIPTEVTYDILIHALTTGARLADARNMFEEMIGAGLAPNLHTYNTIISGYCRDGDVGEARELLLRLEKSSMQPNAFTISSVVNGFCVVGDMEGALDFYAEYKKRGIALDFLGFLHLIEGLLAKGRLEEARSILWDMLSCRSIEDVLDKTDIVIEKASLLGSLRFLCEQGQIDDAIVVLSEVGSMNSPVGRSMSDRRRVALGRVYRRDGKKVAKMSREAEVSLPVTEILEEDSLEKMPPKLCDSGLSALDVEDLINRPKFLDFDVYYPVIASLCSSGELQKASRALKHIMANSANHS